MNIAIFGTSLKKNESRIPLHPDHLHLINSKLLKKMYFEEGYASDFGFDINSLKDIIGGVLPRSELFKKADILFLPKVCLDDLCYMSDGQILFGWPHCVQGKDITQAAINKKLTLIAFEAMFTGTGNYKHHIFHKNNEIAGYASVQHATQLRGITGYYGGQLKASVLGFGSTSRGAIHSLQALGISDITVFTKRPEHLIQQQIPGVKYKTYTKDLDFTYVENKTLSEFLKDSDVIVNCIMQDPNEPTYFLKNEDVNKLKDNSIIIDVSCDEKMAFPFATPTTFENPIFKVPNSKAYYYSVDHTPTLYWNTSSYEISRAILPYIDFFSNGLESIELNKVLSDAIEIKKGVIKNNAIIDFQNREHESPHFFLGS